MKCVMKIRESTRYIICVIVLAISVIGMMVAVATSDEEEVMKNIGLLIIQSILLMWTIIDFLSFIVKQRSEKEQELKPDTNDKLNSDI